MAGSVSYGIIVTLAVCLAAVHAVSIANCPSGKFFHAEEKECVKCSSCPINQIIRLPCSKDRDTQCGPFKEFDKFHQAPQTVDSWEWDGEEDMENRVEGDLDSTSHDRHHRHHHQHRGHSDPQGESEGGLGLPEDAEPLPHPSSGLARVGSAAVEGRWKTLALALIGVLCVVSLFLIIFIVVACYIKQRAAVEKEIILDPDLIAGHDQYVQVRHICSRDRLKPGQEGEDNSDSDVDSLVLPARGGPLLPRPVLRFSDEYDADSSAQSTAKSSDYVYFNSPNNANGVP